MAIRRRQFISMLGSAAAWPHGAGAQTAVMPVVGFLDSASPDSSAPRVAAFRRGLSETGCIDGQNVAIEYRYARGEYDRLPELATDLIARRVSAIAAGDIPAVLAAKSATRTISIIFTVGSDPVKIGLVASLDRPGANLTGVSNLAVELEPKRLELLHELLPTASIIALLVNPTNPNAAIQTRDVQAASDTLGLHLNVLNATTQHDIENAFATLLQIRAGALAITNDGLFLSKRTTCSHGDSQCDSDDLPGSRIRRSRGLVELWCQHRRDLSFIRQLHWSDSQGEKPADLPVQQATKVELIINLKTAKALGLTIPLTLLGRADEVIE